MSKRPTLLLPPDYVTDAAQAIRKAKRRVSFLCLMLADDTATDEFISALNEASLRGVHVEVAADVFTYGELSGHFIPTRYFTKKSRETTEMARRFRDSNVKFQWLGRFANTPFTGRTHIKWCVVDDIVYSFGGVNLYEQGIHNTDYMLRIQDASLATQLDDEFDRLVRADNGHFSFRSRSIPSPYGTVHLDGGLPLDSIIYRRACTLARDAKSVVYVSQYGPTGKLHRLLKKTKTRLYFNRPESAAPLNRALINVSSFLTGNKTQYGREPYLHAKFLLFTMKDGSRVALTGSHNFIHTGVILGTREIALETTDNNVIDQLEKFYHDYVA